MVASQTHPSESPATDALQEIISEFGIKAVVIACLSGEVAGHLEKHGGQASLAIAQFILRQIAHSEDPLLETEVMALGAGIILADDQGVRRIASKHGLTPAAISKRVIKFTESSGLPPSPFMKSLSARASYALSNQPRT